MKVAEFDKYVGSEPIWKYERNEGTFYVRVREKSEDGLNNFIIKSPSGRLYSFYDFGDTEEDAINVILNNSAESEEHISTFNSIYDTFSI